MLKNNQNNLYTIITISLVFSLLGGLVGGLFANNLIDNTYLKYNNPFSGTGSLNQGNWNENGLVIKEADNVVVEQDNKVVEIANLYKNSLVGIFVKKEIASSSASIFATKDFYRIGEEAGQGFIVTSDGWIVTNLTLDKPSNYVVITADKNIYAINKATKDPLTNFVFLRVEAYDFPVKEFAPKNVVEAGQMAVAVNWNGSSILTSVAKIENEINTPLYSSDVYYTKIKLNNNLSLEKTSLVLLNLQGQVIGLVNDKNEVEPMNHFSSAIRSLLKSGEVSRPKLGLKYINLFELVGAKENKFNQGAIIYPDDLGIAVIKDSIAQKAGLLVGDIIISVDSIELNENNILNEIILGYEQGDKINMVYLRKGVEGKVEIEL